MSEISTNTEEIVVKKKRGRKPSKEKKGYFYQIQEQAVVDYLSSTDPIEKNRIFNEILKPAFTKMIESIIRRYNLYPPNEEFQETFDDTISFLMTKLNCFKPETKYKAFSYCGTICKNYLIHKIITYTKNQRRNQSYDNPIDGVQSNITDNVKYSYNSSDSNGSFLNELTSNTVTSINKIIEDTNRYKLTDDEIRVGKALINIMTNWDDLFLQMGSNKFNKSSILLFLKEETSLNTKQIRDSMKVYKSAYYELKTKLINE